MLPRAFFLRTFASSSVRSSHVLASEERRSSAFRADSNDPTEHTTANLSQYYTVPKEDKNKIFLHGGLPKSFEIQTKTFTETCLMIRQPAFSIISNLKQLDYSKPTVRFVIYGKQGSGKSLTLAHVLHYAYRSGFLLVHVPWLGNWMRRPKESSNSEKQEGRIDINLDAAAWLIHFKCQNAHLLTDPSLKMSQDHAWSKRETTQKDAPLLEIIEHGINRIKYASEAIVVLAREIKKLTEEGKVRTLVSVDGFNAFFYPRTRILTEKKAIVHPSAVTPTEAFLNLTKFDWKNAAVVVTVDEIVAHKDDQHSYLPRYLLGKDGFEHMDPFVPVLVPEYTNRELKNCMDYYRERKLILPLEGQDDELKFLSASNPYRLMELCNGL